MVSHPTNSCDVVAFQYSKLAAPYSPTVTPPLCLHSPVGASVGYLELWSSHAKVGFIGSFFGEDPRSSKVYYNFLKSIGCLDVQAAIDLGVHKFALYRGTGHKTKLK